MSVGAWNILLNAVVGVLVFGYGIWLRQIIVHQLKAKDSTIESLHAAIKANEAIVSRLKDDSAPAIAENYRRLKEFAEDRAAQVTKLENQVKELEAVISGLRAEASKLLTESPQALKASLQMVTTQAVQISKGMRMFLDEDKKAWISLQSHNKPEWEAERIAFFEDLKKRKRKRLLSFRRRSKTGRPLRFQNQTQTQTSRSDGQAATVLPVPAPSLRGAAPESCQRLYGK